MAKKPSDRLAELYASKKAPQVGVSLNEPAFEEEGAGILTEFEEIPAPKVQAGPKHYKSADGHLLPIYYKGAIIFIGDKPVEIDERKLTYEARYQFEQALKKNQIVETGV